MGDIADWAVANLGLTESWRNVEDGVVAHAELHWLKGKVSLNIVNSERQGTMGVGLRLGTRESVDEVYALAKSQGCNFSRELMENPVAYSFTAIDPDGNEWWVHMETGMLDQLRNGAA